MKLVKFKNGKFGVRIGNWMAGYSFLDMNGDEHWWSDQRYIERHAQASYNVAVELLAAYKPTKPDYGKVVS